MKKLLIVNKGLLELEALTLLGASTKRDDQQKIGMFGSGNKYALAYFARNRHELAIATGGRQVTVSLAVAHLRDMTFDVLCIDGQRTSITTEFGHKWTLWQAVRELYTNAVDEGLVHFGLVDEVPPCAVDETQIVVGCTNELAELLFNIKDYIATGKEVVFENKCGQILRKHDTKGRIYNKGILVYECEQSIFDYNFTDIDMNENREPAYNWQLSERVWRLLYKCDNPLIIRQVLGNVKAGSLEFKIDDSLVSGQEVEMNNASKAAWNDALSDHLIAPWTMGGYVPDAERACTWLLPAKLYDALLRACTAAKSASGFMFTHKNASFAFAKPDAAQQATLDAALRFLDEVQMRPPNKIDTCLFLADGRSASDINATVLDDVILLGLNCLDRGMQTTALAIVEEGLHIKSGYSDNTRAFQTAIFNEWINYAKRLNAYTL